MHFVYTSRYRNEFPASRPNYRISSALMGVNANFPEIQGQVTFKRNDHILVSQKVFFGCTTATGDATIKIFDGHGRPIPGDIVVGGQTKWRAAAVSLQPLITQ